MIAVYPEGMPTGTVIGVSDGSIWIGDTLGTPSFHAAASILGVVEGRSAERKGD
jgi:hypothetical protein